MNKLFVGFSKTVEPPRRGLFMHDEVPDISRARIFDPAKHSFNPLKGIDYRKARALADVLYTASPQGRTPSPSATANVPSSKPCKKPAKLRGFLLSRQTVLRFFDFNRNWLSGFAGLSTANTRSHAWPFRGAIPRQGNPFP
jgi:hypothetical protein